MKVKKKRKRKKKNIKRLWSLFKSSDSKKDRVVGLQVLRVEKLNFYIFSSLNEPDATRVFLFFLLLDPGGVLDLAGTSQKNTVNLL